MRVQGKVFLPKCFHSSVPDQENKVATLVAPDVLPCPILHPQFQKALTNIDFFNWFMLLLGIIKLLHVSYVLIFNNYWTDFT